MSLEVLPQIFQCIPPHSFATMSAWCQERVGKEETKDDWKVLKSPDSSFGDQCRIVRVNGVLGIDVVT